MRQNKLFRVGGLALSFITLVPAISGCSGSSSDPTPATQPVSIACSIDNAAVASSGANVAPLVVPGVQSWTGGTGNWTLASGSRIVVEPSNAQNLENLANRLSSDLKEVTGLSLPVVTGSDIEAGDIALSLTPCSGSVAQQISNEGYTLAAQKGVVLRANPGTGSTGAPGLFYATRTLIQMLSLDGASAGQHRSLPQGYVTDYPNVAERTVSIDVARQFIDKASLEAYMRFMGEYKINTLHLHLSDDLLDWTQHTLPAPVVAAAFRLHTNDATFTSPPLSDDGLYYSQSDWNELEDTAAANGVTIVPEIDTPAHAAAMVKALGGTGESLNLTNPATLAYVEKVWNEFLPWFRSSKVHLGGDESSDPNTQTYLSGLIAYLQGKGKVVEMWNDSVTSPTTYAPSVVIMNWQNYAPLPWLAAGSKWVNASSSFYVTPNFGNIVANSLGLPGGYEESAGFAGDSFYANDAGLGISHPPANLYTLMTTGTNVPEAWDWFGNLTALGVGSLEQPLGGQLTLWHDATYAIPFSFEGLSNFLLSDAIPAAGQIWWSGQRHDSYGVLVPYATLRQSVAVFQYGPGNQSTSMFTAQPLSATSPPNFASPPSYVRTPANPASAGALAGGAALGSCASCGNGNVVGLNTGMLTMTVSAPTAGSYLIPIEYVSGSAATKTGSVSVNGAAATTQTFLSSSGDGKAVARAGLFANLQAGANTIRFSQATDASFGVAGIETPISQP